MEAKISVRKAQAPNTTFSVDMRSGDIVDVMLKMQGCFFRPRMDLMVER